MTAAALLPTGTRLHPGRPTDSDLVDTGDVIYLVQRTDTDKPNVHRAYVSSGDLGANWRLGAVHPVRHDQTGKRLGTFKVIGKLVITPDAVISEGRRPLRKIPLAVFK